MVGEKIHQYLKIFWAKTSILFIMSEGNNNSIYRLMNN